MTNGEKRRAIMTDEELAQLIINATSDCPPDSDMSNCDGDPFINTQCQNCWERYLGQRATMTNGGKIRALVPLLDNSQLYRLMRQIAKLFTTSDCPPNVKHCRMDTNCEACWVNWLGQEAAEDD